MDEPQPPILVTPGLVEKLTTLLEQAQRGEVTGLAGVVLMRHGETNLWTVLPRPQDQAQVLDALDGLKQRLGAEADAGPSERPRRV